MVFSAGLEYYKLLLFCASVLVIVALVLTRRLRVGYAVSVGALLYGLTTLQPIDLLGATIASFNQRMLEVATSLIFSMTLSQAMRRDGERIYRGMIRLGTRAAAIGIPATIGLLPMPGGAYVSATIADQLYERVNMDKKARTFINYWWRHIWISIWPLYQGVILASAVLHVSVAEVISRTWPAALAAVIAGVILMPKLSPANDSGLLGDLLSLWPLGLVAILSFLLPLPLAIGLTLLAYVIQSRMSFREFKEALRLGTNLNVIMIIVGSLVFSNYIIATGLNSDLAEMLGPYGPIAVFTVPLIIGLATGIEFAFVALTFPPLLGLLDGYMVALAFAGGHIGVMLSPTHSCFVLSSEYFRTTLNEVYPLVTRAILIEIPLIALLIMIL
ncbi:MAG: DUF401 family protein [Thaumarchaeota archaeon]|nr:DUF401 family protein [Candidatus Calditenuaceae archaeon]MDW8187411.1 DUF401 family protein [Nitrososphaerota archaeon]